MATVWDPETESILPETGVEVAIEQDSELVTQEVVYPMLSQTMGFHYGGNFSLAGDGSYTVDVTVGAVRTRRTGGFRDRFEEPATLSVGFDYARADRDALSVERFDDRAGTRDALAPMAMGGFPDGKLPAADALPGTLLGTPTSDDATLATTLLDNPPAGVDGDNPYLAVSARTPHNRRVIPAMALTATVRRDGGMAAETGLTRTLDPELGYHYGATLDVQSGDELQLTPTVQPQVARHEGYDRRDGRRRTASLGRGDARNPRRRLRGGCSSIPPTGDETGRRAGRSRRGRTPARSRRPGLSRANLPNSFSRPTEPRR